MPIRLRKLIGTIVIATFMVFYALLGMTIAVYKLQDTSHMVQLAYYLIVGVSSNGCSGPIPNEPARIPSTRNHSLRTWGYGESHL